MRDYEGTEMMSGVRDVVKGSLVRFPAEAYIIILNFSLTEHC